MFPMKTGCCGNRESGESGGKRREGEDTRDRFTGGRDSAFSLLERSDDACGVVDQNPAGMGEAQDSSLPTRENCADLLFEETHLLGNCRCRDSVTFGDRGHRRQFREVVEQNQSSYVIHDVSSRPGN